MSVFIRNDAITWLENTINLHEADFMWSCMQSDLAPFKNNIPQILRYLRYN